MAIDRSDFDWWDGREEWDGDDYANRLARRDLECQRCGATGLRWLHVNDRQKMGWTLSDDGVLPHECPDNADLDAFEVIG